MPSRATASAAILALIVAAYLLAATLYAVYTPLWQVPDEPAHYNYVRYLAEQRAFPVLRLGDYPHQYLEDLKAGNFPPGLSIDPVRYEFHQPPLYYLLAAGVYALFAGAGLATRVVALRLLSVLFGAGLVLVAHRSVRLILPARPALALGTAAFVAFVPMHLTFCGAVDNDLLAELLLGVSVLGLLRYFVWRTSSAGAPGVWRLVALGAVLGLAMLTKSSVYIAVPIVLAGLAWGEGRFGRPGHRMHDVLRALLLVGVPALALALPWFIRDISVYGGLDFLGLARHDAVVVGQARTAEWLASMGWPAFLVAFARTTFDSFWGQFGWMGVLLDGRLYTGLALVSGLILLGCVLAGFRLWRSRARLAPAVWAGLAALGAVLVLTVLSYFWYNLQFVQHQGRYLFRALIPLGLLVALGVRELLRRPGARTAALVLLAGAAMLAVAGTLAGHVPLFWLAVTLALAAGFALRGWLLPAGWSDALTALPYAGLFLFALYCLFGVIVPYFAG